MVETFQYEDKKRNGNLPIVNAIQCIKNGVRNIGMRDRDIEEILIAYGQSKEDRKFIDYYSFLG